MVLPSVPAAHSQNSRTGIFIGTAEPCVQMKPQNTETKLSFTWLMSYVTFSMQGELHWWCKLFSVYCWLQYIGQLLIISSAFSITKLKKGFETNESDRYNITSKYIMQKLIIPFATYTAHRSYFYVIHFRFTRECFMHSEILCCQSILTAENSFQA
jgi:hypothetical protein